MPERFEFPEGATPIGDCSSLIPIWVHHLHDLNRVEAENIMNAHRKYLRGTVGDPKNWFFSCMDNNACMLITIEQTPIQKQEADKCADTKLPRLEDQVTVPHLLIKLLLRPVKFKQLFITCLNNDPIEMIQSPIRIIC